jgi:hypothetical protein
VQVGRAIKSHCLRPNAGAYATDPILIFRDSECRSEKELRNEADDLKRLAEALCGEFPNVCAVVFNPITEGAFLLFDEGITELERRFGLSQDLHRDARSRRAGRWVDRDSVKATMRLNNGIVKRELDAAMARIVFEDRWPECAAAPFHRVTDQVLAVVRASGLKEHAI